MGPPNILLFDQADPTMQPSVRIFRELERNKKWEIHGFLSVDEATESRVAELFGGGRWVAQLLYRPPDGSKVYVKSTKMFTVPGLYRPPRGLLPGLAGVDPSPVSSGPPVAAPANLEGLIGTLVNRVTESRTAEGKRTDWGPVLITVITSVSTIVTALVTKMVDKHEGPDPRLVSQLDQLQAQLVKLSNQPGPATSAIGDAVKAIKDLLEVRDLIGGGNGAPRDPDEAMWNLGGKFLEVLGNQPARPVPPPPRPTQPGEGTIPSDRMRALPMWEQLIRGNAGQLLNAAMRGIDPGDMADLAIRFLPENMVGVAQEFLRRSDAATILGQIVPELQQFPAWSDQFIAQFRAGLLETSEEDQADVPGPE